MAWPQWLQTWNETVLLYDAHVTTPQVECSHFCHPGAYNVHVWLLWELLERIRQQRLEKQPEQQEQQAAVR